MREKNLATIIQLLLIVFVFTLDIPSDDILFASVIMITYLLTKRLRNSQFERISLDGQRRLDVLSSLLSFATILIVNIFQIAISPEAGSQEGPEVDGESSDLVGDKEMSFIKFIGFVTILIVFSLTSNRALFGIERLQEFRSRYQSSILFLLLLVNKYLDPREMEVSADKN